MNVHKFETCLTLLTLRPGWNQRVGRRNEGLKVASSGQRTKTGYGLVFEVERPDNYPGVYCEFGGQDWSAYQQLNLKIVLRGQEQVLVTGPAGRFVGPWFLY